MNTHTTETARDKCVQALDDLLAVAHEEAAARAELEARLKAMQANVLQENADPLELVRAQERVRIGKMREDAALRAVRQLADGLAAWLIAGRRRVEASATARREAAVSKIRAELEPVLGDRWREAASLHAGYKELMDADALRAAWPGVSFTMSAGRPALAARELDSLTGAEGLARKLRAAEAILAGLET